MTDNHQADAVAPGRGAEESHPSPIRRKRASSRALAFLLQLLLVFVGVWGALVADSWRDRREQVRRTASIVRAIRADISDITLWYGKWRPSVQNDLQEFKRQRNARKHVVPYYVRIPGSEHGALVSWQVALASNALDVLDPEIVFEIGHVSNEMNGVGERFARYMAMTETIILPRLATGSEAFYDPRTGDLQPEFSANVALLEELLGEMDEKMTWLKALDSRLAATAVK